MCINLALTCPFCGKKPKLNQNVQSRMNVSLACSDIDCTAGKGTTWISEALDSELQYEVTTKPSQELVDEVVAIWNTRTPSVLVKDLKC